MRSALQDLYKKHVRRRILRVLIWVRLHVPPGLRLLLGVLLMIGGVFAILPFLGLWMLPAGFYIAALDVVPMWRWMRGRRASAPARKAGALPSQVTSTENPLTPVGLSHPAPSLAPHVPVRNPHKA